MRKHYRRMASSLTFGKTSLAAKERLKLVPPDYLQRWPVSKHALYISGGVALDVRDRRRGKLKFSPRWTWGVPPAAGPRGDPAKRRKIGLSLDTRE